MFQKTTQRMIYSYFMSQGGFGFSETSQGSSECLSEALGQEKQQGIQVIKTFLLDSKRNVPILGNMELTCVED